jgi:hypothetical protein
MAQPGSAVEDALWVETTLNPGDAARAVRHVVESERLDPLTPFEDARQATYRRKPRWTDWRTILIDLRVLPLGAGTRIELRCHPSTRANQRRPAQARKDPWGEGEAAARRLLDRLKLAMPPEAVVGERRRTRTYVRRRVSLWLVLLAAPVYVPVLFGISIYLLSLLARLIF